MRQAAHVADSDGESVKRKKEKSGNYLNLRSMRDEIFALANEFDLCDRFPDAVGQEAESRAAAVKMEASDRREDLRALPLVTIDGPDARDFDDAVFCRVDAQRGYELIVAIADVSEYVRAGGAVDQEAGKRCTSVYFPGHVLPMLPLALSEKVCSLKPDTDRLCLACRMLFAPDGEITDYGFSKAIMRSHARLTYGNAAQMLEKPAADPVHKSLLLLAELSAKLEARRLAAGALKLSLPTPELVFSDDGQVTGVDDFVPLRTHSIIEECMLAANVCAAKFLQARKHPFLYRVHAKPEQLRIEQLRFLLREYGISVGDLEDVRNMQNVIDAVMKLPPERAHALTFHVLRTLSRAVYTPNKASHYGLGFEDYTHFTSPIRRYPDLLVHRQISAALAGAAAGKEGARLSEIGERCSLREQNAEKAERTLVGRMIARLQKDKVGQPQEGIITGITKFGIFVMFSGFAEGLLPLSQLRDDYYELRDRDTVLLGSRTKRMFRAGMSLKVAIDSVDMEAGRCRLRLA